MARRVIIGGGYADMTRRVIVGGAMMTCTWLGVST